MDATSGELRIVYPARSSRGGTVFVSVFAQKRNSPYVYPAGMRETRDLLRRRQYLVHKRAEAIAHIQNTNSQYNHPPFGKKLGYAANREELDIADRFTDPSVHKTVAIDLALIDCYDALLGDVELYLTRTAKVDDPQAYYRLQTIAGVGKILALVLLYEIHDIRRFADVGHFLSYARLVRCEHESGGKKKGAGGKKIGNPHLRWAFSEAACLFLRCSERAKKWQHKQAAQRGEGKALAMLAARLGRAVYHLRRKGEAVDVDRFGSGARRSRTGSSSLSPKEARDAGH